METDSKTLGYTLRAFTCLPNGQEAQLNEFEALQIFRDSQQLVWIHVVAHRVDLTAAFLKDQLSLPAIYVDDALSEDDRATFKETPNAVFLSVPVICDRDDNEDYRELGIFILEHAVVSVSQIEFPIFEDLYASWNGRRERELRSPAGVAYEIIDAVLSDYFPHADSMQETVDSLEDTIFEVGTKVELRDVLTVKRRLLRMRRRVAPLRDSVSLFLRRDHPFLSRNLTPYFHDIFDRALRLVELIDLDRDLLASVLEAHLSVTSNRLNEVMRFMAALSTILMSVSLISGIYGMNFVHMPELALPWGYGAALALMAGVSGIEFWLFRRKGWI